MQPTLQFIFVPILLIIGPPPADTPKELWLKPGGQIVAIGDSITAAGGYLRDIDQVLEAGYPELKLPKVINKGIGGQKAEDLVRRFDADVVKLKPACVTISIGINDVWHRLNAPHDPKILEAYKKNVAWMVDQAQAAGIKVILLAPTVIQEDPSAEGNKRLVQYVEAEKAIAAEKRCQFVDLHGMFLAVLKKKPAGEKGNLLTTDGVHMKPRGDAIMAAGVLRALGVPDVKMSGDKLGSDGQTAKLGLVPEPVSVECYEGSFKIDQNTEVWGDKASRATCEQLVALMKPATGWTLHLGPPGSNPIGTPTISLQLDASLTSLGTETYSLEVRPNQISIKAPTQAGLFYGIQTLRQLLPPEIYSNKPVTGVVWKVPCVIIKDSPRFPWRGLMLDSGHDFQKLPFVFKYIDWMAAHKFNVFHWHLTDLGTWAIEIKKYPKLLDDSTRGKGVKPGYYTQDEIRQVVKYAAERHITVVPEIDMPGHSVPALLAYPELNCPLHGGRVWQYCIGNEKSFEFLQDVLTDICDLFPSQYIHIGGDECPKDRWHQCPLCQARMKAEGLKDEHELQSYFVKRIEKFLNAKGRRLIGWDEILEGGLAPGAAVMSWRGMGGGIAAAKSGHDVVMAPTSHVYFDYPQTTVEKVFSFEPVPKELTKEQAVHVMGAEAEMWSDNHPSEAEIEALVYPRSCALAEVVWSPASARNEAEFMERLSFHQQRLAALGLHYRPLAAKESDPQPTINRLLSKVRAELPKGWTASYEKKGKSIEVSRNEQVLATSALPNAPPFVKPVPTKFKFSLRVVATVDSARYRELSAENAKIQKESKALYDDLIKRGVDHKFDSFIPKSKDDKADVARYEALQKSLHRLPDFYFDDISLEWGLNAPDNPDISISDDRDHKECTKVREKVGKLLTKYDAA